MSTESSILDLILRIRKSGTGSKEAQDDLDKLRKKTLESNDAFGGMVNGLADVKAGFDIAGQVWAKAQQVLDATVIKAANWGDAMGDLAQLTGTTVEETSTLAATFELLGIKQEGLTKIVKAFTAQGLQPTMENVRKLAAEYQAIQDPVARNEFLFKSFGKQAGDVAEVLGKSTTELDQFTEAAKRSGKVINEETAVAAEKLNIQIAKLQQRAEGFGIAAGNFVIPSIVGLFEGMDELKAAVDRGEISWVEYASRLAAVATGHGTAATLTAGLAVQVERLKDDTATLTTNTASVAGATDAWSASMMDAYPSAMDLAGATFTGVDATDQLTFGMQKLTKELIFQAASEGLSKEAKLQLALSMGMINQESVIAIDKIEALKQKYDTNRDGVIDLKESTSGYLEELKKLRGEIDGLQDKTVRITVIQDVGTGAGIQLRTSDVNGNRQVLRASGGPVDFGQSYIVGEQGPELFVPRQSGTIIPNNQINNMGGVTINISGAGDPQAVARAVSRALAEAGRSSDARRRTGNF